MITGIGTPSNHNRSPRPIVFSSKCNRGVNARCRGRFLCGKEAGAKERFTIPEWRLIAVIAEDEGVTQQQVGRRTRMDKVTVSRATIALAERGLLERQPHATDRRSQSLHLTKNGRDLYAAVAPKALELERRIFADFDPKDVAAFGEMLLRVQQATLAVRQEA